MSEATQLTDTEVAAFAFAVFVRATVYEKLDPNAIPGDEDFPVDEWRELFAQARRWAETMRDAYPDIGECVHNLQGRLIESANSKR